MNPLFGQQAEITDVGLLQRVHALMCKQEAEEDRRAEAARYDRLARAEAAQMQMVQRQRIERYTQGHTSEELAAENARREEIRQARIEEHLRELRRLDPARFGDGVRRNRELVPGQDQPPPQQLHRDQEGREFMLRMVAEHDGRREAARRAERQREIRRLEGQAYSGTITRPGGYVTGAY